MMVASTIVPVATWSPLAARWRCTWSNSRRPRSWASSRWRKRHTVVSSGTGSRPRSIPTKPAHRLQIVDRLFHRRVRQVEPLLQKIEPQHPLDPDRRTAIAGLGIVGLDHARTAPTTAPPAPSRPKTPPAGSSAHSAQTPPSPSSAASSPHLCAPIPQVHIIVGRRPFAGSRVAAGARHRRRPHRRCWRRRSARARPGFSNGVGTRCASEAGGSPG